MRLIVTTIIGLFLASFVFAQTNEHANRTVIKCVLAESILMEFKGSGKTNVLSDESVKAVFKHKASEEITIDLSNYADIFEAWAKQPAIISAKDTTLNKIVSSNDDQRNRLVEVFKQEFKKTEPIDGYGGIIRIEMLELVDRRYANATPYVKRIAEVELPEALGVRTCARIKSHYQNPAAEAWVTLTMPEELTDEQKKAWLANFIKREKGLGNDEKKWAIEAAERMLKKMEKAGHKDRVSTSDK